MSLHMLAAQTLAWTNGDLWILGLAFVGPIGGLILFSLQRWWRGQAKISDRVRQAGGSFFLSSHLKEYGYWWLTFQARALIALKVHPTTITLAGMAVVFCGSALVGAGYFGLGGLMILLGSLSDMLDGMVARARDLMRTAGEFVDSLVDRYSDMAVFIGLMVHFFDRPWICLGIGLAAFGSAIVSYARAKAEALGVENVPRGPMQRAERAVLLGFGIFFSPVVARHSLGEGSTYWLIVAICFLIALLANISAVQMAIFTTRELDRMALDQKAKDLATTASTATSELRGTTAVRDATASHA